MESRQKIVIGGFAAIARGNGSQWLTRTPIADYINELGDSFDECTWFSIHKEDEILKSGLLDSKTVNVIPFTPKISCSIQNFFRLIRHVDKNTYVVLHLPTMLTVALWSPFFRLLSKKYVIYIGSDYEKAAEKSTTGDLVKWFGWKTLYSLSHVLSMRMAHAVIARGRYLKELASRYNDTVLETLPIANIKVSSSESADLGDEADDGCLRVLYVGKIIASKGLGELMSAMETICREHKEAHRVRLEIVGAGVDAKLFRQRAKKMRCSKQIHFLGWIEDKAQIDKIFSQAHVLVMPSSTHPEGVPRVIDEALMRGVPVISTKIGGITEEFSEDEVLLVEPADSSVLAIAISKMLFDAETYNHYRSSVKSRTDRWRKYGTAARQHISLLRDGLTEEELGDNINSCSSKSLLDAGSSYV